MAIPGPASRVGRPGNEAWHALLSFTVVCGALLAQQFSWWETQQSVTSTLHLKVSAIVNWGSLNWQVMTVTYFQTETKIQHNWNSAERTLQANRSNTKISHYTHTCKQNLIMIFLISCSPLCCTSHNHSELWWTHSCATDWCCSDDWYYSCWDIHSVRTALRHSNPAICLGVRKVRVIEFM